MKATAIMFCAALLAIATPAAAADFTFIVPVEITNLPAAIDSGKVRCQTMITNGGTSAIISDTYSPPFAIVNHGYSGTIRIESNAAPSMEPANAQTYQCTLWLHVQRAPPNASSYYAAVVLMNGPPAPAEGRLRSVSEPASFMPGHGPGH